MKLYIVKRAYGPLDVEIYGIYDSEDAALVAMASIHDADSWISTMTLNEGGNNESFLR